MATDRWGRVTAVTALGGLAVFAVLLRLPLLGLPLNSDEGGYAVVARSWAGGARLYSSQAWVDRPQGLLLAYRGLVGIAFAPWAVRLGTLVAAALLVVAVGSAGWALGGRRAAVVAAAVTAVVSTGLRIEGYQFNGELASTAVGSCGVAVALWWRHRQGATGWLVGAGALAGGALLMKQSGFDALVVVLVVSGAARGRRLSALLATAFGAVVVLGAAAVQGALTGWAEYWYAVVGFQAGLGEEGPAARLSRLATSVERVWPDLLGLVLVAAVGVVAVLTAPKGRREEPDAGTTRAAWPALVWLVVALAGVVAGPFAQRHYWVQLVAPLALLAGLAAARASARWAVAFTAVAVLPVLLQIGRLELLPPDQRPAAVAAGDSRVLVNQQVPGWLEQHVAPGEQVYAFVAAADLYLETGRTTTYPYLWLSPVQHVPGAIDELARWLDGPDAPQWVVVYQDPNDVDPTGRLAAVLARRYELTAEVAGQPVLRHR